MATNNTKKTTTAKKATTTKKVTAKPAVKKEAPKKTKTVAAKKTTTATKKVATKPAVKKTTVKKSDTKQTKTVAVAKKTTTTKKETPKKVVPKKVVKKEVVLKETPVKSVNPVEKEVVEKEVKPVEKNINLEKKEEKKIENNYSSTMMKPLIIILCIVLITVLGVIYIQKRNEIKHQDQINNSYLTTTRTIANVINNLNEIKPILSEAGNEFFVLINYTGSEDTYNLEVELKDIIDKNQLNNQFYYFNALEEMKKTNYLENINFAFNTTIINSIPTIIYFKNGKAENITKRYDNSIIKAADFQKLLDSLK